MKYWGHNYPLAPVCQWTCQVCHTMPPTLEGAGIDITAVLAPRAT